MINFAIVSDSADASPQNSASTRMICIVRGVSRKESLSTRLSRARPHFGRVFLGFGGLADNGLFAPRGRSCSRAHKFSRRGSYLIFLSAPLRRFPAVPAPFPLLLSSPLPSFPLTCLDARVCFNSLHTQQPCLTSHPRFLSPSSSVRPRRRLGRLRRMRTPADSLHIATEAVAEIRSTLGPLFAKRPELEKAFESESAAGAILPFFIYTNEPRL